MIRTAGGGRSTTRDGHLDSKGSCGCGGECRCSTTGSMPLTPSVLHELNDTIGLVRNTLSRLEQLAKDLGAEA